MVFPLTKLNKEGTLLNASHSYYTEEYAQRMCSLYLTDELSRDDTGKIKKTYRLHASNDHTEEMAFAHEIHCQKCGNRLKQIVWYLAVLGVNTPFKFAVFVREGAAPLPGIKGDRDLDRPWEQISQNQSENDKREKIVQRSQLCDHLVGRRDTMNAESNEALPVSEKYMLTIKEAAAYFNIGIKKLRRIAEDNHLGTVAVYCGNRFLIIRPKFEEFILNSSEI